MQNPTLAYILLAVVFSITVVWFQYYFKVKRNHGIRHWLAFFRFFGIMGLSLLLINPKINKNTYTLEKSNLVLLADNSSSIKNLQGDTTLTTIVDQLSTHTALSDRFNVYSYAFGSSISQRTNDTLRFLETNTNTGKALKSVQDIYRNTNSAIVLLSDGNQTLGNAYEFMGNNVEHPIFPVVIGDTTHYEDLRIGQINKNRYGFLRNKFPMEIYVSYDGEKNINTTLTITENGKNVFRKNLSFSKTDNSKVISTNLEAKSIGIKKITATIAPLQNEKNRNNNSRTVALEVIDEKTNIGIVSGISHPDIGALRKAIESNEQRQIHLLTVSGKNTNFLDDIDLFILYQPNSSFAEVFDHINKTKKNMFVITGTKTDWSFLNSVQSVYEFQSGYPIQEVEPVKNLSFSKFDISDFNTDGFPPLSSNVSRITSASGEGMILGTKIRGIELESPLLDVFEQNGIKNTFLFGEGLWKWRMQAYRNAKDFRNFDEFIGKMILYLSSSKPRNRFMLEYDNIYQSSADAVLTATVFDEAFVFDDNANIVLVVKAKESSANKEYPMLLKQFSYEADLSDLPAGEYTFTASEKKSGRKRTGNFTILDYDVEKQFLSADRNKLQQLATNTNGGLFYPSESQKLIDQLLNDKRFTPVQKRTEKIVPLVDFKWLLGIIIAAFAMEWLLRKYNGLT